MNNLSISDGNLTEKYGLEIGKNLNLEWFPIFIIVLGICILIINM